MTHSVFFSCIVVLWLELGCERNWKCSQVNEHVNE